MSSSPPPPQAGEFKRFDVVTGDSASSDNFFNNEKPNSVSAANKVLHKRIMKEWSILKESLPDTIYVRAYESRVDLMRAAIIGAAGTPYQNFLFFFDIAFPDDYPLRPPLFHYMSAGHRINPNLYAKGTVCLSLLNTWSGKESERWNPFHSTILQVLLSIQALVLNEKPCFNEPAHSEMSGEQWENISSAYNQRIFLLCCKTVLSLLRSMPRNFEPLVTAHFRDNGSNILSACLEQYYNPASTRLKHQQAEAFRSSIVDVYLLLQPALTNVGASVENFPTRLKPTAGKKTGGDTAAEYARVVSVSKQESGTVRKIIDKVKGVFMCFLTAENSSSMT